jgi:two-component system sensor histidine kinase AlgZ
MMRVLLLAEGLRFAAVFAGEGFAGIETAVAQSSGVFEPALLTVLAVLFLIGPWLGRLPYRLGGVVVLSVAGLSALAWKYSYLLGYSAPDRVGFLRVAFGAVAIAFALLFYFNWRYRVLSPALSEARLLALQSRIRPHFLFNSLNTVLGLIRDEPRRAESVLENLAELFRALMSEPNMLVPLGKELELARAYVEVEKLRIGDRLSVNWRCQHAPSDALVPPLILQPLLENAVYHGVEPLPEGGTVSVTAFAKGDQVNFVVRNPLVKGQEKKQGNRMALNNIRERLDLHFDAEAAMRVYEAGGEFVVQIRMPYKHG